MVAPGGRPRSSGEQQRARRQNPLSRGARRTRLRVLRQQQPDRGNLLGGRGRGCPRKSGGCDELLGRHPDGGDPCPGLSLFSDSLAIIRRGKEVVKFPCLSTYGYVVGSSKIRRHLFS